jgi:outer membrane receptor protein involved in Fe transport
MKRAVVLLLALAAPAQAQNAPAVSDIEVPAVVIDLGDQSLGPSSDDALDLANIVQSAAKGVTTVQEAPAIVTVVTADEIRDRQFQDLEQLIDTVPGWSRISIYHSTFPTPLVRGQVQAVQFLHDGVSLFDPFVNVPSVNRSQPMELIKRVEMITGPGGVLWGSNSLLGILNVITKDAEDVEGIEVGGGVGQGDGDRSVARAYVMAGKADISHGNVKLFGHASVETYQGAGLELPLLFFHEPLPQPNSANTYGPLVTTDQAQSLLVTLDGKVTIGKLQLRAFFPMGSMYKPAGFSGEPARDISDVDPANPTGPRIVFPTRLNRADQYDRYGVAEYRTRFAHDKAGFTAHGYMIQFVRGFSPLGVLEPSAALPGGLAFESNLTSYRAGGAFDGDVELAKPLRVLYGAEAFHEWKPIDTDQSRQGAGNQSEFPAPSDLTRLPILCPREYDPASHMLVPVPGCPLTFAYDAARTVLGAYVNPQWRPTKTLIFDAGARISVAPEALGSKELAYSPNPTFAGTIVWNFITNWHLKLNYAEGFRPPVFNNTLSNGEGVQIGGNPNLLVEQSKAGQAEINARIFKGDRRIRELSFRIDGSYTKMTNLIQVSGGNYGNSGERGLASGEFLGKLYIQGGHRIELGYTYLRGDTSDKGRLRSLPEHWFNLATVWNLVSSRLTATTNIKIVGAAEDPNRLVEYRGLMLDANGQPTGTVTSAATDLVLDRLPPIAELSAGVQFTPTSKISIRATVYDALFAHSYQPDVFFDYEPHLEYLPNPYEGFRAYLSALVQY